MRKEEKLRDVLKWEKHRGKSSLVKFLKGVRITRQEAIEAKCYECMGGWPDGIQPCLILDCSLNPYNPYFGEDVDLKDNIS
jgi:hypothetical protein